MGLLMIGCGRTRCPGLVGAMALAFWLAGALLSLGGGNDPALPDALRDVFPGASDVAMLSPKSRFSRAPEVLEVRNSEALLGYGVSLEVASRSGPFRIWVAVSPGETVMAVKIPKYPHRRGRGVRKKTFLEQFRGVSYGEPLKLGEQIDGVSGATSSGTAITDGVRQALILVHRYRQGET